MTILIDTHVLLWWLADEPRLGPRARDAIASTRNEIIVSVVSLWEIVIKVRVGKLQADVTSVEQAMSALGFRRLDITPTHLESLVAVPLLHNDPFDHLIVAQAIAEDATLMTADVALKSYPVRIMAASS